MKTWRTHLKQIVMWFAVRDLIGQKTVDRFFNLFGLKHE